MLNTKFKGQFLCGSGKEDFWKVFTLYGPPPWSSYPDQADKLSFPQGRFICNLASKDAVASENKMFWSLILSYLGQRSSSDLEYSQILQKSFSQVHELKKFLKL